jgi:hypothetical protein
MDSWIFAPQLAVDESEPLAGRWEARWIRLFVALGIAARLIRYALRFPLWEDEAFLAANFLHCGYLDLAGPLDYFQVCPLGFLWVQLTIVKLLGFNEYTLRLVPLLAGLASLLLFRHLAGRFLKGAALVLAVAIFSVSYPCIRYSVEAKQYGVEMFVSLVLLTLVVQWWRRPERTAWLWTLAAFAPVAVWLSYSTIFVGGAASLFVAWILFTTRTSTTSQPNACKAHGLQPVGFVPWLVMTLALAGSLAGLYFVSARHQGAKALEIMQRAWGRGFPPLGEPLGLLGWLADAHTGEMLAYPVGARHGGSTVTLLLCLAALVLLARRRRWGVIALCLGPLALSLAAAALRRYPYGQMTKFQLFAAPAFCLLAGLGAALLALRPIGGPRFRPASVRFALLLLMAIGLGCVGRDFLFPAKSASAMRARDFARWFWFTAEYDGEVACLRTDLGESFSPLTFQWGLSAIYLCNQRIYSPRHARGEPVAWERISAEHPLRCVEYRAGEFAYDAAARDRWLQAMQSRYVLVGREQYAFAQVRDENQPARDLDHLEVYKFVPRSPTAVGSAESAASSRR